MVTRLKFATGAALVVAFTTGMSQWSYVDLNPPGILTSRAIGNGSYQQSGYLFLPGFGNVAALWSGSSDWINLHPAGATASQGWRTDQGIQVGGATFGGQNHAGAWHGTAESFIDLNPIGALSSGGNDIKDGTVVGYANVAGIARASLWSDISAGNWIDLHPPGAASSYALSTDGVTQVGWTYDIDFNERACTWSGTKGSYQDIHPPQFDESGAVCIGDNVIGGYVTLSTAEDAAIWIGPERALRILKPYSPLPFGYSDSMVSDVAEGIQVGYLNEGKREACLWESTAGTWLSLEKFLPPGATSSEARGIWTDDEFIFVSGFVDYPSANDHAFLWIAKRTVSVAPASLTIGPGVLVQGNSASVAASDDNRIEARPGPVLTSSMSPIQFTFNGICTVDTPSSIEFTVESHTTMNGAELRVWLYNFDSASYELLTTSVTAPEDTSVNAYSGTNAERFVEDGTRVIRAKVGYRALGPVLLYPWKARVDRAIWKFPLINN